MIWESISSCIATYGWLSALVVTFLVIVATQFYYFYKSEERDILENVRPAQENMSVGEMLTSEGYTEERLRDVADYAWMLQNYDSNGIGDQEANDVKLLDDENSKAVVQDRWDLKLLKDLRTTLTTPLDRNDVQDTDSMLVNTPEDEDQEMDILDLTPDDISINCDEDADEEDAAISPQAMADIEAEMLDSSILSENLDEQDNLEIEDRDDTEQMISSIDKPKATSTAPSELQSSPTAEEMEEEKRTQQYQLAQILELMQQNPNMFGKITQSDMDDQARLYNM